MAKGNRAGKDRPGRGPGAGTIIQIGGNPLKRVDEWVLEAEPGLVFSGPDDPDLVGEFFDPETNFGHAKSTGIVGAYYDHGLNPILQNAMLGQAKMTFGEGGIAVAFDIDPDRWDRHEREKRRRYALKIMKMAEDGFLGASSGVPDHLIRRKRMTNSKGMVVNRILDWPIAEFSITPTPCEPRTVTQVQAYKSLGIEFDSGGGRKHFLMPLKSMGALRGDDWSDPITGRRGLKGDDDERTPQITPIPLSELRIGEVRRLVPDSLHDVMLDVKSGRAVSRANGDRIRKWSAQMRELCDEVEGFLDEHGHGEAEGSSREVSETPALDWLENPLNSAGAKSVPGMGGGGIVANKASFENALKLIENGQFHDGPFSFHPGDGERVLCPRGEAAKSAPDGEAPALDWDSFSGLHIGIDPALAADARSRYAYPIGKSAPALAEDGSLVETPLISTHGIACAKSIAMRNGEASVVEACDRLIAAAAAKRASLADSGAEHIPGWSPEPGNPSYTPPPGDPVEGRQYGAADVRAIVEAVLAEFTSQMPALASRHMVQVLGAAPLVDIPVQDPAGPANPAPLIPLVVQPNGGQAPGTNVSGNPDPGSMPPSPDGVFTLLSTRLRSSASRLRGGGVGA